MRNQLVRMFWSVKFRQSEFNFILSSRSKEKKQVLEHATSDSVHVDRIESYIGDVTTLSRAY